MHRKNTFRSAVSFVLAVVVSVTLPAAPYARAEIHLAPHGMNEILDKTDVNLMRLSALLYKKFFGGLDTGQMNRIQEEIGERAHKAGVAVLVPYAIRDRGVVVVSYVSGSRTLNLVLHLDKQNGFESAKVDNTDRQTVLALCDKKGWGEQDVTEESMLLAIKTLGEEGPSTIIGFNGWHTEEKQKIFKEQILPNLAGFEKIEELPAEIGQVADAHGVDISGVTLIVLEKKGERVPDFYITGNPGGPISVKIKKGIRKEKETIPESAVIVERNFYKFIEETGNWEVLARGMFHEQAEDRRIRNGEAPETAHNEAVREETERFGPRQKPNDIFTIFEAWQDTRDNGQLNTHRKDRVIDALRRQMDELTETGRITYPSLQAFTVEKYGDVFSYILFTGSLRVRQAEAESIVGRLGVVEMEGRNAAVVAITETENFMKFYLGKTGLAMVPGFIGRDAFGRLRPGWDKARFAVVGKKGMAESLGIMAEYEDGSFAVITRYPLNPTEDEKAEFNELTKQFIMEEAAVPRAERLEGWEEIPGGAAIKEAFTSQETDTGMWGNTIPVVDFDCNLCLRCLVQCPDKSLSINPVTKTVELFDPSKCKACGVCASVCHKHAITMPDKSDVRFAQANVFHGISGKKIIIMGDTVKEEAERFMDENREEPEGYEVVYRTEQGLSRKGIVQVKRSLTGRESTLLYTYIRGDGGIWTKIVRPYAAVLVYGMQESTFKMAGKIQEAGFYIHPVKAPGDDRNNGVYTEYFRSAGYTDDTPLPRIIKEHASDYDAVVTDNMDIARETYRQIRETEIGTILAPYLDNSSGDPDLDRIIKEAKKSFPPAANPLKASDRPMAETLKQKADIASGHKACAGCPIFTIFNMAMRAVHEGEKPYETEIVNSGSTGCAEVITTLYPDTAWRRFLHTVFGAGGANLAGMNAAYRFLRKTERLERRFKFFNWAGDGGTYDIGLQSLSGYLERGLAKDSVYVCYDNGAYMNTGIQRSSATPQMAGTSTTPIGEIIRGKPQFRKNLLEFAKAHRGVYVATVSVAHEADFKRKIQKAMRHNGPALIIAYSNCTTGHNTSTEKTVEQSLAAVESGYWPLIEIENGETRVTIRPPFVTRYEVQKQQARRIKDRKKRLESLAKAKREFMEAFTGRLREWMRSEGRFALHFNADGTLKRESEAEFVRLYDELKTDWVRYMAQTKGQEKKDILISILREYLKELGERSDKIFRGKGPLFSGFVSKETPEYDRFLWPWRYTIDPDLMPLRTVLETAVLPEARRQINPDEYYEIYGDVLSQYRDGAPLEGDIERLGKHLYETFVIPIFKRIETERRSSQEKKRKFNEIRRRIENAVTRNYAHTMNEDEKARNRAVMGHKAASGRIFARAGDGGVTQAKLFVTLLRQIGIFGKASPDYGPERRGAPVGTNFQLGGSELRTQAGYDHLDISIVKDPEDTGWAPSQWRDSVKDGGIIVAGTALAPDEFRKRYNIKPAIAVYTFDAKAYKRENRVPETVTLLGAALKALSNRGIDYEEAYLMERWEALLNKQFAAKAKRKRIVEANKKALKEAFHRAAFSDPDIVQGDKEEYRNGLDISSFGKRPPEKLLTGSEAVAEAWRQINPGVFAMFPITPSTEVGQVFSQFWADGLVDTEYVHTESEHTSFMAIIAAAACGVRAVTSTASQGMLLGKEGGLLAASLRLPLVVNVGNRETNAPLSIHAGHTDAYQFRDDGWIQLFARNAQEAYDFAIIAQKAAERARLPVFLNQDGFIVTHTKDMLDTLTDKQVKEFVGEYDPEDSLLKKDMTLNPVALQNYYSEHTRNLQEAMKQAGPIIDDVMEEFYNLTGRDYRRVKPYKMEDADAAIVCMGSVEGTAMDAADAVRGEGIKAGVLSLKTFRPFPEESIRKALSGVKTVIVMDRMGSLHTPLTPLATEVKSAIGRTVLNLEFGRGGRNTPRELVEDIYRMGMVLGTQIREPEDLPEITRILAGNEFVQALLTELAEIKGKSFKKRFMDLVIQGRFIEAYGPKEHIDVREAHKARDIKYRIIEEIVRELGYNAQSEPPAPGVSPEVSSGIQFLRENGVLTKEAYRGILRENGVTDAGDAQVEEWFEDIRDIVRGPVIRSGNTLYMWERFGEEAAAQIPETANTLYSMLQGGGLTVKGPVITQERSRFTDGGEDTPQEFRDQAVPRLLEAIGIKTLSLKRRQKAREIHQLLAWMLKAAECAANDIYLRPAARGMRKSLFSRLESEKLYAVSIELPVLKRDFLDAESQKIIKGLLNSGVIINITADMEEQDIREALAKSNFDTGLLSDENVIITQSVQSLAEAIASQYPGSAQRIVVLADESSDVTGADNRTVVRVRPGVRLSQALTVAAGLFTMPLGELIPHMRRWFRENGLPEKDINELFDTAEEGGIWLNPVSTGSLVKEMNTLRQNSNPAGWSA